VDVAVEEKRVDVEDDERAGEERDEPVHVRHGEGRPARQPRATGEEDAEQHAGGEQRVTDDARGAGRVPVDPVHDVWLEACGVALDDGATEPPAKVELRRRSTEDDEVALACDTVRVVDDVPAAGCPCRARARTRAKPAVAASANARFATLARLRPASILVGCDMSP
jgi:hypothetical protein